MDQLSPQDAQFLYLESPDNLTHLTSVGIFDPVSYTHLRPTRLRRKSRMPSSA